MTSVDGYKHELLSWLLLWLLLFAEIKLCCSIMMKCDSLETPCCVSGVPPPGPGVMVMQLSVPNGPQPSQNPPLVQWNPCKYYSVEQRPGKPGELYKTDNTPQVQTFQSSILFHLKIKQKKKGFHGIFCPSHHQCVKDKRSCATSLLSLQALKHLIDILI